MKSLIIYQTLSGSTLDAAGIIAKTLSAASHGADLVSADAMDSGHMNGYDAIIIGSPSWEDEGMDGQPLPEVRHLIERVSAADLVGKRIAVFGLGDTAYPRFCGAVDVIEALLKEKGVTPVITSLRIDRYYSLPDNEKKVAAWAAELAAKLVA